MQRPQFTTRKIMIAVVVSALVMSMAVEWRRQSNRYAAIAAYHAERIQAEAAKGHLEQMRRHIDAWGKYTEAARFPLLGVAPHWRPFWIAVMSLSITLYTGILAWGVVRFLRRLKAGRSGLLQSESPSR